MFQGDPALSYRRLKVEDAIAAAWQALQNGVVAGGGSALASIEGLKGVGGDILNDALKSPAKQIALNAGFPDMTIGYDYKSGYGFDTREKRFVNMFEAGIVDPANIVINACRNAISVAAAVLTCGTVITLPREDSKQKTL